MWNYGLAFARSKGYWRVGLEVDSAGVVAGWIGMRAGACWSKFHNSFFYNMNRWCSMYWKIVMAIILMKTIEPPIISMAFPSNSNGSVYVICTSFKIPRYCMCLQSPVATPPGTTQRTSSAWKKVGSHGFHWWPFFKHSILLCSVPLKTWRPISFMLMTSNPPQFHNPLMANLKHLLTLFMVIIFL